MTKDAETYFLDGCGRCALGGTPECKVHRWQHELLALRRIALECGLDEACKWGVPCYTFQGKNIAMVAAFKEYCFISFFKGSLLQDEHGMLEFAGKNSQVDKMIRFTDLKSVLAVEEQVKTYLFEGIEVEKAGLKVPKGPPLELPEELQHKFEAVPALKAAFETLTPGKQRGWALYFSAPKQAQTRAARIEKSMQKIMNGEGLHDKW